MKGVQLPSTRIDFIAQDRMLLSIYLNFGKIVTIFDQKTLPILTNPCCKTSP